MEKTSVDKESHSSARDCFNTSVLFFTEHDKTSTIVDILKMSELIAIRLTKTSRYIFELERESNEYDAMHVETQILDLLNEIKRTYDVKTLTPKFITGVRKVYSNILLAALRLLNVT